MERKVLAVSTADGGADAADDFQYISGVSTILVANIQEVKDRVSQMEFIFCNRLFPHFQANSKLLQARLDDAMKAAEDEWRKKEAGLVIQLEELNCWKRGSEDRLQQLGISLEETKGKLVDAERLAAKHDAEKKHLLGRLEEEMKKDEVIRRLEREIGEKAAEISREREAHQRLLQLESSLEEMKGKLVDADRLAAKYDAEKKQLLWRLEEEMKKDEVICQLEREIGEKAAEISKEREAHQRLLQLESSLEETKGKLVDADRLAAKYDAEKKQLLGRLEEEMKKYEVIRRLEREIGEKAAEITRKGEDHQRLLQQMELKDKEFLLEKNRSRDLIEELNKSKIKYKSLKSQYNHATRKLDQIEGSKSHMDALVDRRSSGSPPSKRKLKDLQDTKKESIQVVSTTGDQKNAPSQHTRLGTTVRSPFSNSRLSLPSHPTNPPQKDATSTSKTEVSSSFTRPSRHWRETRARKEPGVVDPHEDFLDTPLQAIKNTILNPTTREEAPAVAASPPQDMDFHNSDDETQDINIVTQGLNNRSVPKPRSMISVQPPNKGFKYTEPVRKKADRENLKGVECKQCKKFYDAVLPDGRVNGDGVDSTSMRCEHHDGVSRHRYREKKTRAHIE
ncbi:hypothetical protein BRADI_1g36000v3 [Brachypodium distachyon]|uniref:DNA endonuclease activator Ctp1 C-terminal domain-containing protein n=1 Tax=Brachypodium distachyon TaxID=15368 RepID=A0A2K2DMY7_BRADI|nr:hypothetical protein BRADI_1g36000v3 [Brachypodium distachyon]